MDKKDEIIKRQLELIRQMSERNIHSIGTDIWGTSRKPAAPKESAPPPVWDGVSPVKPFDAQSEGARTATTSAADS